MEPKKNPLKDVHRYSKQYFLVGLIISCSICIMAFNWTSEKKISGPDKPPLLNDTYLSYYPVPVTVQEEKSKPTEIKKVHRIDLSKIDPDKSSDQEEEEPNFEPEPAPDGPIKIEMPAPEPADSTFVWAEKMPEPVGGYQGFYKMLAKNMKYPALAKRRNIDGKVLVEFVVDGNGKPTNMKVINGIGHGCDEEAMRVLMLAKWEPGKQRGNPVKVKMVLPVYFRLQ